MATYRFVDFSVPEAQLLADLTGAEADLMATEGLCGLMLEQYSELKPENPHHDSLLKEALCAAAIIRYARSFVKGVRISKLKDIIGALPAEQQESHGYFMTLRHRWVAHSVNDFEYNEVHAYLTPEEIGPRHVSSISVQHSRIILPAKSEISKLTRLAKAVREKVAVEITNEKQKVLEYARSLPVDSFYDQEDPPFKYLGKKPEERRKKF